MTDTYMITYRAMRDQCQRELDGMEECRQALQATIAGLDRLIKDGSQIDLGAELAPTVRTNGSKVPVIPPDFFRGKKPTQAYQEFVKLWGADHPVPQIRDALIEGGIQGYEGGKLLAALHSVLRRERLKNQFDHIGDVTLPAGGGR